MIHSDSQIFRQKVALPNIKMCEQMYKRTDNLCEYLSLPAVTVCRPSRLLQCISLSILVVVYFVKT